MHSELTNLLPHQRKIAIIREYRLRLGVVVLVLVSALIGVAALLLMPTYLFLLGSAQEKQVRLAHITSKLSSADEATLSARLAALSTDAAALIALSKKASVSGSIRSVLGVSRPGVTLSGFTYAPAQGKALSTIVLSGTAVSRDALRGYQLALQSMPTAASVTLPVSVYAKDTNISFTITITLTP